MVKGVENDKASILMMNGCFWGRSIAACSGSDDLSRYKNFGPLTPGFPLVDFNDVDFLLLPTFVGLLFGLVSSGWLGWVMVSLDQGLHCPSSGWLLVG